MGGARPTIVVGAGVAGLSFAWRMAAAGRPVVVLEREREVGGLARSFCQGPFVFDVGPHRFHTDAPRVERFVGDVLGDEARTITRRSAVWLDGRAIDWPLGRSSLLRLPPSLALAALRDLLGRRPADGESFADYVRHRYGEALYERLFRPYTERFVCLRCEELSRDWARTGIERAVIDGRAIGRGLGGLASALLRRPAPLRMVYPQGGGIGQFAHRLAERVRAAGGVVRTGSTVTRIEVAAERVIEVEAGGEVFSPEELVWTGSLVELCELLGRPRPGLRYLQLLLFTCEVRGALTSPYQWCYFSDPDLPFSRLSFPTRFDPALAPTGHFGIAAEVPVLATDELWHEPERLTPEIVRGLVRAGVVSAADAVERVEARRIADAYPIYTIGYRERLDSARQALESIGNLELLGRNATFWYNNMDHSIAAALRVADRRLDDEASIGTRRQ